MCIEIYLREQMYDDAIKMVLGSKDLATLRRYHKELSGLYPLEYFQAYKELIVPFLDGKTGRDHYREVISYLKKMNDIEGFKSEFEELIKEMRVQYSRRPAFIDEMKVFDRI